MKVEAFLYMMKSLEAKQNKPTKGIKKLMQTSCRTTAPRNRAKCDSSMMNAVELLHCSAGLGLIHNNPRLLDLLSPDP